MSSRRLSRDQPRRCQKQSHDVLDHGWKNGKRFTSSQESISPAAQQNLRSGAAARSLYSGFSVVNLGCGCAADNRVPAAPLRVDEFVTKPGPFSSETSGDSTGGR